MAEGNPLHSVTSTLPPYNSDTRDESVMSDSTLITYLPALSL